jgi:hypothetical protein
MDILFISLILLILIILSKKKSTFTNNSSNSNNTNNTQKIGIISVMYKPKNLETWLDLHRSFGISHFYIRLEDTPELVEYLKLQPDVTLEIGTSNASNQYMSIMDRQLKMANDALKLCPNDGISWLIQIDCDEILEGDINEILSLADNIDTFWMQNHEAVYENIPGDEDNCFTAKKYRDCGKEYCASYINGKGGGRVCDTVESDGCHRFKGKKDQIKLNKIIVKHYESCDFNQYIKKYQRYQKGVNFDDIPFEYYRESIKANGSIDKLKIIYKQYRVAS